MIAFLFLGIIIQCFYGSDIMQKFRDYLYCDENRINTFISQIEEIRDIEVSSSHETNSIIKTKYTLTIYIYYTSLLTFFK